MKPSLSKNYLYNLGYQVLQMLMPLITAPYISRVLGSEGMGIYSYTHSVAYYFLLAGMLGVNTYGNRSIAKVRDNQDALNREFSSIFQLQLITSTSAIVVYLIFILFGNLQYKLIYIIQLLYIISAVFDINWLFFGLEEFRITVVRKTIIKVATACAVFLFVKNEQDLPIYTAIMAGGYTLGQCYLWLSINKYVSFVRQPLRSSFNHIAPLIILFAPTVATSIYRVMDKIMLGYLGTYGDVGLYEAADKIIIVCLGVVSAWGTVMLPRISNLYASNRIDECKKYYVDSIELVSMITSAMCFGLAAVASDFIPLFYGEDFGPSVAVLKGLSFSVLFIGISNTTRNQMLIPMDREKSYLVSVTVGAIVNVVINYFLIQRIGIMGAVVSTICTEAVVASVQLFYIRDMVGIFRTIVRALPSIVIGMAMYCVVQLASSCLGAATIVSVIIEIVVGGAFFAFASLAYYKLTNRDLVGMLKSFK